jgi:hypothetical protein
VEGHNLDCGVPYRTEESAIVSVPTGGRKKKLKHTIAASDVLTAIHRLDVAATTSTMSRNVSATMVPLVTSSQRA